VPAHQLVANLMSEPKRKLSLIEVFNLLGSIASVTGVSLLWMRDKLDARVLFVQVPVIALWAGFVLAFSVAGYYSVVFFRLLFENESTTARLAATVFATPFAAAIVYGLAFLAFQLAHIVIRDLALP
jgi:hypothetical protein